MPLFLIFFMFENMDNCRVVFKMNESIIHAFPHILPMTVTLI